MKYKKEFQLEDEATDDTTDTFEERLPIVDWPKIERDMAIIHRMTSDRSQ